MFTRIQENIPGKFYCGTSFHLILKIQPVARGKVTEYQQYVIQRPVIAYEHKTLRFVAHQAKKPEVFRLIAFILYKLQIGACFFVIYGVVACKAQLCVQGSIQMKG